MKFPKMQELRTINQKEIQTVYNHVKDNKAQRKEKERLTASKLKKSPENERK